MPRGGENFSTGPTLGLLSLIDTTNPSPQLLDEISDRIRGATVKGVKGKYKDFVGLNDPAARSQLLTGEGLLAGSPGDLRKVFVEKAGSVAAEKGSYDPGYAASKAAIQGMINSFANEFQTMRFNAIALGLVENSPVFNQMTPDFLQKHRDRMHQGTLIQLEHIAAVVNLLLTNENLNRSIIPLTSGFR
jgi:hypothetical protein